MCDPCFINLFIWLHPQARYILQFMVHEVTMKNMGKMTGTKLQQNTTHRVHNLWVVLNIMTVLMCAKRSWFHCGTTPQLSRQIRVWTVSTSKLSLFVFLSLSGGLWVRATSPFACVCILAQSSNIIWFFWDVTEENQVHKSPNFNKKSGWHLLLGGNGIKTQLANYGTSLGNSNPRSLFVIFLRLLCRVALDRLISVYEGVHSCQRIVGYPPIIHA